MQEARRANFVVTKGVTEYRATIPRYVNGNDVVLEVGCGTGRTTEILSRYAAKVVGIDPGEALEKARETYPHIQFERIDGFDIRAILGLGLRFTKVYIDISGNRDILDVVKITTKHAAALKPEVIVVKSSNLKRYVSRCAVWAGE